jgi:pimeloyl-ACP methyl ester carboxylesterase
MTMAALSALLATVALAPAAAHAQAGPRVPVLNWQPCDSDVPELPADVHFQCATAAVPLDYSHPHRGTYHLALMKKPAVDTGKRLGSLLINYGGPGGTAIDDTERTFTSATGGLWGSLNDQYDIVAVDPRGVGRSEAAMDCGANQITEGIYSMPFATPDTDPAALLAKDKAYVKRCVQRNRAVLPYVTTGNFARDLDLLRQAVGDKKLNYLGFSYGTFLGATYAALFPGNVGRVVLDGPVDADSYINHPSKDLQAQTSAFERELSRFFAACAGDQVTCQGFGDNGTNTPDPEAAFDALVDAANANPIPVAADNGVTDDLRPVTGDDILNATIGNLYNKHYWGYIVQDLVDAENGDGAGMRFDSDYEYGYDPDSGTFDPLGDRYFLIGAVEQHYPNPNLQHYLRLGRASYDSFDHFWFNAGYVEANYGIFPVKGNGIYRGPFTVPQSASTPLVVATTYDPATPYRGAKALVRDMGNARLLTMIGDGHTAYGGESACIDQAVDDYLLGGTLPAAGTTCRQETPFAPIPPVSGYDSAAATAPSLARQKPSTTSDGRTRIGGPHERQSGLG